MYAIPPPLFRTILLLVMVPVSASATIVVNSFTSTGVQAVSANSGTTLGQISSFAHTGNGLVVTVQAIGENAAGFNGVSPAPTVSFGASSTSTPVTSAERSSDQYVGIFYFNGLAPDTQNLVVSFGTDIYATGAGAWEISAFSLSNIDTANPIASFANLGNPGTGLTDTLTSSGLFGAGDYIIEAYAADNSYLNPNFQTALDSVGIDGSDGTDYGFTRNGPNGLTRWYTLASGLLEAGDFVDSNSLVLTQTDNRAGIRPTIVLNSVAIPEPATWVLIALTGLSLTALRRRG